MNVNDFSEPELAQYMLDTIEDFEDRYSKAWKTIGRMRYNGKFADQNLFYEMEDRLADYCEDNDLDPDDYDLEEIFF